MISTKIAGKIAILGVGNLGYSIVEGLQSAGLVEKGQMILAEKNPQRHEHLASLGYTVSADNVQAVKAADLVMLVVKPFQIVDILTEIAPAILVAMCWYQR